MKENQLAERVSSVESNQADLGKALAVLTEKMEGIEDKFNTAINFLTEKTDLVLTNLTDRLEKSAEIDEKLIDRLDKMAEMFSTNEHRLQKVEDHVEITQKHNQWIKKTIAAMLIAGLGAMVPKLFTIIYLLFH